jgi:hypothetical protein
MAIFIVFAGTLAQVDKGIWAVMDQYFRCWVAWIELKIFFPDAWSVKGGFPFPGGWLLGAALLANLVISHASRIRIQARGGRLLLGAAVIAIGGALTALVITHVFEADSSEKKIAPSMRVTFQLLQGGGAALVLFMGCWMVFRRKAGIVLLHSGVVLLMLSELVTGLTAEEALMKINKGESSNYGEVQHETELAFVDSSGAETDDVVVIPEWMLRRGGAIPLADLPFEVEVLPESFHKNASLRRPGEKEKNPATQGAGVGLIAVERAEESGVDSGGGIDMPVACVKLRDRAARTDLGTWLVSLEMQYRDIRQTVRVGSKSYQMALRHKRLYKPYRVYLQDLRLERYKGTETARDYSSIVRLEDPDRGVVRERVRIWMNNPLRYRGETLYQSGIDEVAQTYTILQIVQNRGWMVPYLACMIVAVGLLGQFLLHFVGFLKKQGAVA